MYVDLIDWYSSNFNASCVDLTEYRLDIANYYIEMNEYDKAEEHLLSVSDKHRNYNDLTSILFNLKLGHVFVNIRKKAVSFELLRSYLSLLRQHNPNNIEAFENYNFILKAIK